MALFWLKAVHTLIALVNIWAIAYVLWCGITNRHGRWLVIALGLIVLEVMMLAVFGGTCPLQYWARQLQGADGPVRDIFLPNWLAANLIEMMTPFVLVGFGLVLWNFWRRRGS